MLQTLSTIFARYVIWLLSSIHGISFYVLIFCMAFLKRNSNILLLQSGLQIKLHSLVAILLWNFKALSVSGFDLKLTFCSISSILIWVPLPLDLSYIYGVCHFWEELQIDLNIQLFRCNLPQFVIFPILFVCQIKQLN